MHDLLARQMIRQRLALRLARRGRHRVRGRSAASAWAISSASPVSSSSSCSSSCSIWRVIRSDERPNCMRRSLAIWNLSFSISSVLELHRELSGLQLALAGQRKGAQRGRIGGQFGRGERHGDSLTRSPRIEPESAANRCVVRPALVWIGSGGAIVRRQSIASISTENCAGVSVIAPSTIGGQTKRPFLKTLGNQPHAGAVPVKALEVIAAFAAKDEQMAAERIGADHLLHLRRQAIEAVAQIDRTTGEEHLGARRQADHVEPLHRAQHPRQRLLIDERIDTDAGAVRQRDLDRSGFAFSRMEAAARAPALATPASAGRMSPVPR